MKKFLLILLSLFSISTLIAAESFPVKRKYQQAYRATCAVLYFSSNPMEREGATGVLLDSGYILTAKHVLDYNDSGFITSGEKTVKIQFFYPQISPIYTGTVVYCSPGRWQNSSDFAFIKVKGLRPSKIDAASDMFYNNVGAGEPIYTIGRTKSYNPPHITFGHRSTDVFFSRHRASIDVFYGNSGGGIFLDSAGGKLLGIVCRNFWHNRGPFCSNQVPSWTEYIPIIEIRRILKKKGKLELLDAKDNY